MKVSIVMAYYNRKTLLESTLKSIQHTSYDDYEIVIVDDASNKDNRIEDLVDLFDMDIRVIRIDPNKKTHINPCIPYNIGFKEAKGDIVIIQNPECYHLGDIVSDASNLKDNEYRVYHCYSLPEDATEKLVKGEAQEVIFEDRPARHNGDAGYYVHGVINSRPYHFCSAMLKKDLDDLGGFDERYANGKSYDDDEFAVRIFRKDMHVSFIANPMVAHQWHYTEGSSVKETEFTTNRFLYFTKTLQEKTWRANCE